MIKFFNTGHLSRYIAAFFLLASFWLPAFLNPIAYASVAEPAFLIISNLIDINPYFPVGLALLISIFSALLANQIATDFEFSSRFSSLGVFFFVLLSSSLPEFLTLNPIILSNVFILFLLKNIFRFPVSASAIPISFNSGLLIGIASLFYPPLLILLFFLWGAIFIHRLTDWRNFAASLIGIIMPYLFLFTWYLWAGSVIGNAKHLFEDYFFIRNIQLASFSINYLIMIILLLIIVVSALNTLGRLREKNINLRRNLMVTVLYLAFVLLLSWYYGKIMETMLLIAVPAALLLANSTSQSKKLKLFNIVIYLLLGLILFNFYYGLFNHFIMNL